MPWTPRTVTILQLEMYAQLLSYETKDAGKEAFDKMLVEAQNKGEERRKNSERDGKLSAVEQAVIDKLMGGKASGKN